MEPGDPDPGSGQDPEQRGQSAHLHGLWIMVQVCSDVFHNRACCVASVTFDLCDLSIAASKPGQVGVCNKTMWSSEFRLCVVNIRSVAAQTHTNKGQSLEVKFI